MIVDCLVGLMFVSVCFLGGLVVVDLGFFLEFFAGCWYYCLLMRFWFGAYLDWF